MSLYYNHLVQRKQIKLCFVIAVDDKLVIDTMTKTPEHKHLSLDILRLCNLWFFLPPPFHLMYWSCPDNTVTVRKSFLFI